ncbi:hypothetical protein [Aestuariimicrobium sp. T2.26MG-19.2B]|uniref:hypothetical protein n=1 Tax=Aestuariimicrobium sp. T2.26MG-19.2B TaxID=3040679 RepID=UPI002477C737|nr:hypothetical protein [Aestuariimicrobium sp. T2.26MG-19.2B]CAI9409730.1 hypothetical protein AESSP_02293 [Aestuariimicrobium sp. T2.26MG-19.2B]
MNPIPMTPAKPELRLPPEVVAWRGQQLLGARFPEGVASELAGDARVDLHALLGLVDKGCPPELAARILSPVPDPVTQ